MTLSLRLAFAAFVAFVLVFMLGIATSAGWFARFDVAVAHMLNLDRDASPGWLILLMQAVSWIGGGIQRYVMVGILAAILWRWWGATAGIAMALTSLASAFTSEMLKAWFGRIRPELSPHLDFVTSAAYPSGHANNAAVVYILFIMLVPQARHPLWQLAAAVLIVLTGLSRIMLGVHWMTDVIGGWMLGTAFALAAGSVIAWRRQQREADFPSILAPTDDRGNLAPSMPLDANGTEQRS